VLILHSDSDVILSAVLTAAMLEVYRFAATWRRKLTHMIVQFHIQWFASVHKSLSLRGCDTEFLRLDGGGNYRTKDRMWHHCHPKYTELVDVNVAYFSVVIVSIAICSVFLFIFQILEKREQTSKKQNTDNHTICSFGAVDCEKKFF